MRIRGGNVKKRDVGCDGRWRLRSVGVERCGLAAGEGMSPLCSTPAQHRKIIFYSFNFSMYWIEGYFFFFVAHCIDGWRF